MTITFNVDKLTAIAEEHGDNTRAAIAERVGVDEGSISRYMNRKRRPSLGRVSLIARAYGVDINDLLIAA